MTREHNITKHNVKQRATKVCATRQRRKGLQEFFDAWNKWAYVERDIRSRTENLKNARKNILAKKAVKKWAQRTQKTKTVRAFVSRAFLRKQVVSVAMVFHGWRKEARISHNLAMKMASASINLQHLALQ